MKRSRFLRGVSLVLAAGALMVSAASCGQGNTIVVVIPSGPGPADASSPGAATTSGPEAGSGASPSPEAGFLEGDAGSAVPRMDSGTPNQDAAMTPSEAGARDASSFDAVAPRPDPGPYGCAEAPFHVDGGVCLVGDPCAAATYRASAALDCMFDGDAELLTCASSSPYLRYGNDVPPTGLLQLTSFQEFPVRLRTPEVTTGAPACPVECAGQPSAATGIMRFRLALPFRERMTVKVGPPWKVAVDLANPFCAPPGASASAGCTSRDLQTATITVFTTELYAPKRDVIVDVSARTACP
jgi:hypothetical protein